MAAKKSPKPSPAMAFLVDALKKNRKASFADLKAAAAKKKLKIIPVMYGRAQLLLGIAKPKTKPGTKRSKTAARTHGRPVSPTSKSARIRELLKTDMSAAAIAKKLGCTTGLVYQVKSAAGATKKRSTAPTRSSGRPSPTASGFDTILTAIKNSEKDTTRMRAALERIRDAAEAALA